MLLWERLREDGGFGRLAAIRGLLREVRGEQCAPWDEEEFENIRCRVIGSAGGTAQP